MRRRVVQGAAFALGGWLIVACSSGSSPDLQSSATISSAAATSSAPSSTAAASSATSSSSPLLSSSPETSSTISPSEADDRAAAEAQWTKYAEVYAALPHTPEDQWDTLLEAVAVQPMITNAKSDARTIISKGRDTYGTVVHRISWTDPINGEDTAVLHDCDDGSQTGAYETATGDKVTVGVPRRNTMGTLVRGADGIWRVSAAYIVKETPC